MFVVFHFKIEYKSQYAVMGINVHTLYLRFTRLFLKIKVWIFIYVVEIMSAMLSINMIEIKAVKFVEFMEPFFWVSFWKLRLPGLQTMGVRNLCSILLCYRVTPELLTLMTFGGRGCS